MQSFILGAGLGTRLQPLTSILPKPLMPVFQKPLVQHILDYHYKAGIEEFLINISHLAPMWERAFPENKWRGRPVHFSKEERPLDSGGGLKKIMPFVHPGEPLLVHNGDILTDLPLDELLDAHRRGGHLVTLALRSIDGNKNVGFDQASGLVTDMRHALGIDSGSCQFAGVYVMEPEVARLFPDEELFSIVPIWLQLIREHKVGGVIFDRAQWYETGSPAGYLDNVLDMTAIQRIHDSACIHPMATLSEDCAVGAGARIPEGTELTDCIVWPRTHVKPGIYHRCILTPRLTVRVEPDGWSAPRAADAARS